MEKSADSTELLIDWYSKELECVVDVHGQAHAVVGYVKENGRQCTQEEATHAVVSSNEQFYFVPLSKFLHPH